MFSGPHLRPPRCAIILGEASALTELKAGGGAEKFAANVSAVNAVAIERVVRRKARPVLAMEVILGMIEVVTVHMIEENFARF